MASAQASQGPTLQVAAESDTISVVAGSEVTAVSLISDSLAVNVESPGTVEVVEAMAQGPPGRDGRDGTDAPAGGLLAANNLSDVANASTSRTNLGLGTIATQNANNVTISGGAVTGITDLTVADGGTGASTAAAARTNLGIVIGTDVQAYDAELAAWAGLASAADKLGYFTGSGTAALADFTAAGRAILDDATAAAQATTLGLGTADSPQFTALNVGHATDTTITRTGAGDVAVEGNAIYRAGGTDVPVADGGTGASDAATARTNLGLGTIATQAANNVSISGGSVTGITDLAVADGGTGASTAAAARTNLGLDEAAITFVVDGGGSAITTGLKAFMEVPYACTVVGWTILADVSGSIVVDVWKDTYANFPPTVADTIAGTEKPTLSAAQKNQDLALTTWTTALTKGDILAFNVDSAATVKRVVIAIRVTR